MSIVSLQLQNIRFVKEIRNYPRLYDFTHPEYSRKDLSARDWNAVGRKFDMTGSDCKYRWRNLRSVFSRKVKEEKLSGKRKSYYLNKAMQFCIPYIKNLQTKSFYSPRHTHKMSEDEDNEEEEDPPPSSPPISSKSRSPSLEKIDYKSKKRHKKVSKNVNRKDTMDVDLQQYFVEYLKAKSASFVEDVDMVRESKKMFLLSLLSEVSMMSDGQLRVFKRRMLALVDETLR